jgi:hypothetical protein
MRVAFLRRPTRAVLVIWPYPVLQRCDVEAKDQFLALNHVVLAAPYRDVPLVTAVVTVWLARCRAHVRHGVIVFKSGPSDFARSASFKTKAAVSPGFKCDELSQRHVPMPRCKGQLDMATCKGSLYTWTIPLSR